jgi:hypothetical protein
MTKVIGSRRKNDPREFQLRQEDKLISMRHKGQMTLPEFHKAQIALPEFHKAIAHMPEDVPRIKPGKILSKANEQGSESEANQRIWLTYADDGCPIRITLQETQYSSCVSCFGSIPILRP